ncbi:MAG: alpha/beta hydrolase [Solirubrobacteraceae bacterium]|nr:alpha/beta hydrolase [Solirubrobacteraceae bacterium]
MRTRSSLALLGPFLILVAALGLSPAAHAALPWRACSPSGFQCSSLSVPLDREGLVPGSITLSATRKPATAIPQATTAIIALAGGPGQAAQPFASTFADIFGAGLGDKDLLVFDQRGTGKSGLLGCAAFRNGRGSIANVVGNCARQIGARRGFFRTADSVEDIEALRVAGGYSKLVIFGVSYGTKVALAYAAQHPENVDSLILDSTVPLDGPDALARNTLATLPRVLGQTLCAGTACADASPDVNAEVSKLAARLARRNASGPVYTGAGQRKTAKIGPTGLLNVIQAGDLNPEVRAELPGAVHAAIQKDLAPLLRLSARSVGLDNGDAGTGYQSSGEGDGSLYFATMCEETGSLPWDRAAGVPARMSQAEAFVKGQPAATWGLFPSVVALTGLPSLCVGWPNASPAPAAPPAMANVRTLLIAGQYDTRTPAEDAQRVAAALPQAQLVGVPFTGHSVLTAEQGTCAQAAVDVFLKGGVASADCSATKNAFPVTRKPPRNLAAVPSVKRLPKKVGRTMNGILLTMTDLSQQVVGAALATGDLPSSLGGLRGGYLRVRGNHRAALSRYEFVPGLELSGTYNSRGTSVFRVTGSASNGSVKISESGHATGRIGGKKIDLRPKASSARAGAGDLTWAEAAAHKPLR